MCPVCKPYKGRQLTAIGKDVKLLYQFCNIECSQACLIPEKGIRVFCSCPNRHHRIPDNIRGYAAIIFNRLKIDIIIDIDINIDKTLLYSDKSIHRIITFVKRNIR
jgi:hypothetical protein